MYAALLAVAALAAAAGPRQTTEESAAFTLGEIEIRTDPIYSEETAARQPLAALVNVTHWTTRDSVVRREIWIREGESISESQAAEIERNLRATGLFAEAHVTLRETDDAGVRDLVVVTRDKLSISGGASASFVGDFVSGGVSLAESNLFGTGDRLGFSFRENDDGERRGSLSYRDRYFLGTWTTMTAEAGETERGNFAGLAFSRPFRHLADPFAWSLVGRTGTLDRDYFADDDVVAEVPFDEDSGLATARWRSGTRDRFWTRGLVADFSDRVYGPAEGPAGGAIRVPGDTTSVFLGGTLSGTDISEFRKVQGLDTIDFIQDLRIGSSASASAGVTLRDEAGMDPEVQPTFRLSADTSVAIGPDRYFTARLGGNARLFDGDAVGWAIATDLHAYDLSFHPHTIAASIRFVEAEETQDLPVQLILGEGNGLRGYPRRQFTGERLLRLNLEDRIDLDARIGAFHFGAVVFADIGWIEDRDEGFGEPRRSVGFGMRIGSESILGANVLRVDLSFPLDDIDGESFDPLLSASLGQVFDF
ncbi:MAG: hypothetical protein AAGA20_10060 [Planctomycetota bacterium]